jgi:hypothetical protein
MRPTQIREICTIEKNPYYALSESNSRPAFPAFANRLVKGGALV